MQNHPPVPHLIRLEKDEADFGFELSNADSRFPKPHSGSVFLPQEPVRSHLAPTLEDNFY
jgi:hypothetical protein